MRVVVRVRPITGTDADPSCSALTVDPDRLHVALTAPLDRRACKRFTFDAALDQATSQAGGGPALRFQLHAFST